MGRGAPVRKIKPPTGFKKTSVLHNLAPHPFHFRRLRQRECRNCIRNSPCCQVNCEIYKESLEKYEELDLDPCSKCEKYQKTCTGVLGSDEDGLAIDNQDFPDENEIYNSCPF